MKRFLLGLVVGLCLAAASATAGTHWISVSGWLVVYDTKAPTPFRVEDCQGRPCRPDRILPADAIRMTGRSGDTAADVAVAAWLIRHDGQRIRVTWTVE